MFKYGSFRLFLAKFILGSLITAFAVVYLISLYSYSQTDPGFKIFETGNEIKNYFGLFGAYLASYSMFMFGQISYFVSFFILIEGVKNFLGIKNSYLVLKIFSNLTGVLLINIFLVFQNINFIYGGEVSLFLSNHFSKILNNITENILLQYVSNIFILVIGLLLLLFSFSLKFKFFKKIFTVLKVFKLIKYFKFIFFFIKIFKKPRRVKSYNYKSEPTIKKSLFRNKEEPSISKRQPFKQLEIEQFKFTLPKRNLLLKSPNKGNINKEVTK